MSELNSKDQEEQERIWLRQVLRICVNKNIGGDDDDHGTDNMVIEHFIR